MKRTLLEHLYLSKISILLSIIYLLEATVTVTAVLPSANIDLYTTFEQTQQCLSSNFLDCLSFRKSFSASQAFFGRHLHFGKPSGYDYDNRPKQLVTTPLYDPLLCNIHYPNHTIPFRMEDSSLSTTAQKSVPFSSSQDKIFDKKIVLIPRGECDFERKALNAQQLGAHGVIIYNTLASRYDINGSITTNVYLDKKYAKKVIKWPQYQLDYDCDNGRTWVPQDYLSFQPLPYNSDVNDPLLGGGPEQGSMDVNSSSVNEQNLCNVGPDCKSQRCLLTGNSKTVLEIFEYELMEACCAWDIYMNLGSSIHIGKDMVNIPISFITMRDGDILSNLVKDERGGENKNGIDDDVYVVMYEKGFPRWNWSSYFMWMIGVLTTWLGSWLSAHDLRKTKVLIETADIVVQRHGLTQVDDMPRNSSTGDYEEEVEENDNDNEATNNLGHSNNATIHHNVENGLSNDTPMQVDAINTNSNHNTNHERNNAEYNIIATTETNENRDQITFEVNSTEINNSAASATSSNVTTVQNSSPQEPANNNSTASVEERLPPPLPPPPPPPPQSQQHAYNRVEQELNLVNISPRPLSRMYQSGVFFLVSTLFFLIIFFSRIDVFMKLFYSVVATISTIKVLIYPTFRFIARVFRIQKTAGSLICRRCQYCGFDALTWLDLFSIGSGVGLGIAWTRVSFVLRYAENYSFYWVTKDIFGFHGATPSLPEEYCEKYPDISGCIVGVTPFPITLTLPLINDYRNGITSLNLGVIIVPGSLLGFFARIDASKRLLSSLSTRRRAARRGITTNISRLFQMNQRRSKWKQLLSGYFIWLTTSYAVGLLLAYILSSIRKRSTPNPVFSFLSPLLLFTTFYLGTRRKDLYRLWEYHDMIDMAARVVEVCKVLGPEHVGTIPLDDSGDDDTVSVGSSNTSIGELENNNHRADNIVLA